MLFDSYDLDPPEFFCEEIVQARREHTCCECRQTIRKGEKYRRSTGKWNGDFSSFATCNACVVLWTSVSQLGVCQQFGGLAEAIGEIIHYGEAA